MNCAYIQCVRLQDSVGIPLVVILSLFKENRQKLLVGDEKAAVQKEEFHGPRITHSATFPQKALLRQN